MSHRSLARPAAFLATATILIAAEQAPGGEHAYEWTTCRADRASRGRGRESPAFAAAYHASASM